MANSEKISYSSLFDFSNPAEVDQAIKKVASLDAVYESLELQAKQTKDSLTKANKALVSSLKEVDTAASKLQATSKKDQKLTEQQNAQLQALTATYDTQKKEIASLTGQIQKLSKERTAVAKKTKDINNINKEAIALEAQIGKLTGQNAKETAALKLQKSQLTKQLALEAKEAAGLVTIYQKTSAKVLELSKQYKNYVIAGKEATTQAKKIKKEHDTLRASIIKADASVGQFQRNVGNYKSAFGGLASAFRNVGAALGFTGVLFGMVAALKSAFSTVVTFQKGAAVLAGVLNKTMDETKGLTDNAKELGATTAKSAVEVSKLQLAYARLGFTQSEIIELTSDTINGSIALNAELSDTAELTGAMVRTFDELSTTDAGDILDSLTLSAQKSALNFDKLQSALPIVAGAANAAGISFTRTVALLGKLSDAGIDASSSATSLRNIFIESASQGLNYEDILIKIGNSQDKLTASNDQFGKRVAVSSSILSNLVDEVGDFDKALQDAGGTAERVANTQLDTLTGDIDLLSSAWEGWVLSIDSGDGAISKFVRGSLQALTNLLTKMNTEIEKAASPSDLLFKELKSGELTVSELNIELIKLEATITASGRAATKQKELIREDVEAINEAKKAYESWLSTQKEGQKLIDKGLGVPELTAKLDELQGKVRTNTRGSKVFQETQKEIAVEILAVAAALGILDESLEDVEVPLVKLIKNTKLSEEELKALEKAAKEAQAAIGELDSLEMVLVAPNNAPALTGLGDILKANQDKIKEGHETVEELERQHQDKMNTIRDSSFQAADIIGNQLFTNQQIRSENQLKNFENQKNFELELAGDNAQQRAAIEADFAIKEKAIRLQQAKAAKKQALFNVTIQTAQAVVNALATLPYPAAPIAAIAAGAIGAVQTGAILSQPLPAFEKGGIVGENNAIMTSEKGYEYAVRPDGKMIKTGSKGAEIRTDIPKGSVVLNHAISKQLDHGGFDHKEINENSSYNISKVLLEQKDRQTQILAQTILKGDNMVADVIEDAIRKIPMPEWNISDGKLKKYITKAGTRKNAYESQIRN